MGGHVPGRSWQTVTKPAPGGQGGLYPAAWEAVSRGWGGSAVSLLRLMPFISELLAHVRAELEMSGSAAG